tara:strand:+ start:357 stop:527 length:171 start_codon:yes stop_codon:yes gene_type:complete
MITNTVSNHNYRLLLEQIRRKMKESKVKPITPTDNNGELTREQIPKKKNNKKPYSK